MPERSQAEAGLFSLFGVKIRIHPSWLIIALFIAWSLASGSLPILYAGLPKGAYWGMAAMIVVGIAVSIVLHELAHTLVGRAMGISVNRITLFLFGGVAELTEEPKDSRAELAMAIAGPAFSVVFGIVLAFLAGGLGMTGAPDQVVLALGYLARLNLILAAFNMVPAFPLDGGRVLRAIVWMSTGDLVRATRIATRAGEALALMLMAAGLALAFTANFAAGLWWIMIGLFLHAAARGARLDTETRQLFAGHSVAEFMASDIETAPAAFTLEEFIDERLLDSRHGLYPVECDGRWIGVVTPEDILRIPRRAWANTTLGEICQPASETPTVGVFDEAGQVIARMRREGVQRLPVVQGGDVIGIVTLQDLLRSGELWRRFRPAATP